MRKCARIQSFLDDFVILGAKTSRYKQVGNAEPTLLAQEITTKIKQINFALFFFELYNSTV